ncbi:MAG: class I SAM-dependent methyltransferase [Planctomycetota bacterium]
MPQVDKSLYFSETYLNEGRFLALREQVLCCIRTKCKSFLEVGPGPGFLTALLTKLGMDVRTVDSDRSLKPDIIGDVLNLPCPNEAYDVVCAFQVLEHLPFESVSAALSEMNRVSRGKVIFSVPDHMGLKAPSFSLMLSLFGRTIRYERHPRPRYSDITNPEEHHWEIGCRCIELSDVLQAIQKANMRCSSNYLPCAYFHFFVCNRQ